MPKNIIGAGFSDFVTKQIKLRQEKNKLANKDADTLFYQNTNTAFLRLSSGVDVGENNSTQAKIFQLYNTRFNGVNAQGVGLGGNRAYGWQSNSGYGFVPPPGLVSADIKSMNRGSLREANINILCHSIDQFNIIDQLYLRLGYTMLLEWGWSHYFANPSPDTNNLPKFQTSYHNIATDEYFFSNTTNYVNILNQIQNDRKKSCGNYDAMLGRVVNYSWSLEKDGSYNITLTMRAVGDVIESLKTNTSLNTATNVTDNTGPALNVNSNKSTLNKILYELSKKVPSESGSVKSLDGVTTKTIEGLISNLKASNTKGDDPNSTKDVLKVNYPYLKPEGSNGATYNQFYIKLGKLIDIIQNFLLYYSPKQSNQAIINFSSDRKENFCFTFPAHGSLDPRVCLIPIKNDSKTPPLAAQNPDAPTGVNYNYLIFQDQYVWYEIKQYTTEPSTFFGLGASNTNARSLVWDPNSLPGINFYIPDEVINKLRSLSPSSVITLEAKNVPNGGTQSPNVPKALPEEALNIIKNTSISGENLQNEYVSEWTSETFFDGNSAQSLVDITPGKEYLINGGVFNWKIVETTSNFTVPGDLSERSYKYEILKHTAIVERYINPNQIVQSSQQQGSPSSDQVITKYLQDTGFRVDDKYIGSIMDIYINMDYITTTLSNYIDINTNTISIFDFLEKLMSGVQNALGCVNNFVTTYNEDDNTFRIIDSTFIPNLDKLENVKSYFEEPVAEFITHTLDPNQGSFIRDASVKTKLSNNFATQVTIGAQANGNVVGENATALSRWNVGLYDRIIKEKLDTATNNNTNTTGTQNLLLQNFSTVGALYGGIDDRSITTEIIESSKNAGVDLFKHYVGSLDIPGIGFLPIDLELTMDGLSGIKIYESYTADTRILPARYKNAIQFITTGVSHKIQNNDWTTTLSSISGPKYDGVTISSPKSLQFNFVSRSPSDLGSSDCSRVTPLVDQSLAVPRQRKDKNPGTKAGVKLNDIKARNQKFIWSEYLPTLEKIPGLTKGLKVLITAQAIHEGYWDTTASRRNHNPGNIGNKDDGSRVDYGTLENGIKKQISYVQEVANGTRYKFGKITRPTKYSKELKQCTSAFEINYQGELGYYLWVYATGPRVDNGYLEDLLGFFQYNGININYKTKIQDIIKIT